MAAPVTNTDSPVLAILPPRSLAADRYRVLERRDVRRAVDFELVFLPVCTVLLLVTLGREAGALVGVGLAGLCLYTLLAVDWRLRGRRHPHPTAFAIGIVVLGFGVAAASTGEAIASFMSGMFAIVVVGCAVFMPWSPRWHAAFLVLAVLALALGLVISPITSLEVTTGIVVGVASVLTSGVGMWLARRRSLRLWSDTLELRRKQAALRRTVRELEETQRRVRRLEGILPICASCKRIRDGEAWFPVEGYLTARTDAQFSHGICPECAQRLYPEEATGEALA